MSSVEFEEDDDTRFRSRQNTNQTGGQNSKGMVPWLIRSRIVKDEKSAEFLLYAVIGVCVLASLYLLATSVFGVSFGGGHNQRSPALQHFLQIQKQQ